MDIKGCKILADFPADQMLVLLAKLLQSKLQAHGFTQIIDQLTNHCL